MKKIIVSFQGVLDEKNYECALTFTDILEGQDIEIDFVFLAWKNSKDYFLKSDKIKIIYLEDPSSVKTYDNKWYINLNRQIRSNDFLLDYSRNRYEYIVKMRSDIKLINKTKFKNELLKAIDIPKIWVLNTPTSSPRLLTPISLKDHISDWFFGGTFERLNECLQLEEIDEYSLLDETPYKYKNFIFWRRHQNEQLIWKKPWATEEFIEPLSRQWQKRNINNSMVYANYLYRNFYLSSPLKIGLNSNSKPLSFFSWYLNTYSIINLNIIETFLLNKGMLRLLVFYPPVFRYLIYTLKITFSRNKYLRF